MSQTLALNSAIQTIDYRRVCEEDLPYQSDLFNALGKKMLDITSEAQTIRWAILTGGMKTMRHEASMPDSFEITDGQPTRDNVDIGFIHWHQPYRFKQDIRDFGTSKGMLVKSDLLSEDLEIMNRERALEMEWLACTSYRSGILFKVKTSTTGTTIEIEDYGGHDGEELGAVLDALLVENRKVNFADALDTGGNTSTVRNSGTGVTITGYNATKGSETITVSASITVVAGDIVYMSRENNPGDDRQTSGDSITGLPLLCNTWGTGNLLSTFQTLTTSTAPRFQAKHHANNGIKRELEETLLRQAIQYTQATAGRPGGEWGLQGLALIAHPFTVGRFADRARQDRRYNVPLGNAMLEFQSGVKIEATTFMGHPFIQSNKMLRNSVFGVDCRYNGFQHKGAMSGEWLPDAEPNKNHRVTGGFTYEVARYGWYDMFSQKRNCNFWIQDIVSDENI